MIKSEESEFWICKINGNVTITQNPSLSIHTAEALQAKKQPLKASDIYSDDDDDDGSDVASSKEEDHKRRSKRSSSMSGSDDSSQSSQSSDSDRDR